MRDVTLRWHSALPWLALGEMRLGPSCGDSKVVQSSDLIQTHAQFLRRSCPSWKSFPGAVAV